MLSGFMLMSAKNRQEDQDQQEEAEQGWSFGQAFHQEAQGFVRG